MSKHEINILREWFDAVENGIKTCEIRKDDRNYRVGDTIILREWEPLRGGKHTGRRCAVVVTHKVDGGQFGIEDGVCVLSIRLRGGDSR